MSASNESPLRRPLYVYDLPPKILATLQRKEPIDHLTGPPTPGDDDTSLSSGAEEPSKVKAASCTRCNMSFMSWQEQRSHFKSDLHGYNTKLRLRGAEPVNEEDFEKLVGDLDESISGSESSGSDTDEDDSKHAQNSDATMLSSLLKKQARLQSAEPDVANAKKRKRGSGKPPLIWFSSSELPSNTSLGIYQAIFSNDEQEQQDKIVDILQAKQLVPSKSGPLQNPTDGGVALPKTHSGPHVFLCMIGGGHFAAMIVSLTPKLGKKQGLDERQAAVIAHKTFHRYTTRRKQGGSQSANDSAKGAAHSAGSSLRRYNESALTDEIRALLGEWKSMIDTSELLFIRATGSTNRRTLFGPYEGQVLRHDDPRNRGFPFSTRRATQAELMRCFVELTRVKVSEVDEAALAAQAKADEDARSAEAKQKEDAAAKKAASKVTSSVSPEDEIAALHTTQIESMVRRSKAPALLSYLTTNSLSPDFRLHPLDSQTHYHAPTPLHLASSINSPAVVTALLVKAGADPTTTNLDEKTAFEIAGDRATRDAFRLARSELGESKWDWEGSAKVPDALSRADVEKRADQERREEDKKESERRKAELDKLRAEEARKDEKNRQNAEQRRDKNLGKGKVLSGKEKTAEERREEESRGMTPEMRMKLERERRARAAEERMRRMQAAAPGGSR